MTAAVGKTCWTDVAAGWDRHREEIEHFEAPVTERLLANLPALAGRAVLELGAGTGALAERLADAVGPVGRVIASDAADGMVARLHIHLDGRTNVSVQHLDAGDIALPDALVDAIVFRMGLMMAPDPARALEQVRRVLRPGGRLVTAVWGPPMANPWLTLVGMAAASAGLVTGAAGPPTGPGEPFSLADRDRLAALAEAAGFAQVTVETVDALRHYADADDQFARVSAMAPPLAAAVATASPDRLAATRAQLRTLVAGFATPDGLALPMQAHVLAATAP
jgi:SAM-dependent methyltransferase